MTVFLTSTTTAPPPPPVTRRPQVDALRFAVSRGGQRVDLTGAWMVLHDVAGLDDLDTIPLIEDRGAGLHGAVVDDVDVGPREVFLPLSLRRNSIEEWRAAREELRAVTNPMLGPCRLTVTRPDGYSRWIEGYALPRREPWTASTWSAAGTQRFGLFLRCPSPWWRSASTTVVWETTTGVQWFPILPVRLASSRVLGVATPTPLSGDAPTHPGWLLRGPFTQVTATHVDTGRYWQVIDTIAAGDALAVTTDPQAAGVKRGDGSTGWDTMRPPYDFWPLQPGPNTVLVEILGANTGTRAEMLVNPAWAAA